MAFLIPTRDRFYCTALMCSPPGADGTVMGGGGVMGGGWTGGGGAPVGVKVARLLSLDSLPAKSKAVVK